MHVSFSFPFIFVITNIFAIIFFLFHSNHSASSNSVAQPTYTENVEKSLCNLNGHLATLREQMVELNQLTATLNKMVELLGDDLKAVMVEQAELVRRLLHGRWSDGLKTFGYQKYESFDFIVLSMYESFDLRL